MFQGVSSSQLLPGAHMINMPSNLISVSYRLSSLSVLAAGRKIHTALTRSSLQSLHALTAVLLQLGIPGLRCARHTSVTVIGVPLPQHISSLRTETSNLSCLRLKCPSFPLLFILPSTTLKALSTVALRWHFLIPAFPLYPQSSEFL